MTDSRAIMRNRIGHDPTPPLKRRGLWLAQAALQYSGMADLFAARRRDHPAVILMYHSAAPPQHAQWIAPRNWLDPATFESQMQFLARRRRVVSVDELLAMLDGGQPIPRRTVVLTFDDGYLDNLSVVAPILERLGLPAVLYLTTSYIDRGENQWADQLFAAFTHRTAHQLDLNGASRDLSDPSQRIKAHDQLAAELLEAAAAGRRAKLESVIQQLRPAPDPPRLTMRWDDVRRLTDQYPRFALGVHTTEHLDLTSRDPYAALADIQQSMNIFEQQLGRRPHHFSFPYSRSTADLCMRLPDLGLKSAMTGEGVVDTDHRSPFDLPRIETHRRTGRWRFQTSGAYPALSQRLFGRA
ncbi:MAG: polysaccharide deacetylase [Planctomycetaceae bacterium]|nr:polysaccharide deacetylase [Planctomycetaceae bacterium]